MDSSSISSSSIWEEIELSERHLVRCMFEEAVKLSSSIIHRLRNSPSKDGIDDIQLADMMASAGMVFIQSMQSMGRILELFIELKVLFGSVASIPVPVFLTGACIILTGQPSSNLKDVFEEFLTKWKYKDGEVYILVEEGKDSSSIMQLSITAEQYVKVAEVYAITLLGTVLKNPDVALSWAEEAMLPEESRQSILSRLHSLCRLADSNLSSGPRPADKTHEVNNISTRGTSLTTSRNGSYKKDTESEIWSDGNLEKENPLKPQHPNIQRIKNWIEPCFWWYRTVHMKYGNIQLVLSQGNLMLVVSLMIVVLYVLRNKTAILKRFAAKQASSLKRALVDVWQLAFSVQVNPLAAIQQVPSAPYGSR